MVPPKTPVPENFTCADITGRRTLIGIHSPSMLHHLGKPGKLLHNGNRRNSCNRPMMTYFKHFAYLVVSGTSDPHSRDGCSKHCKDFGLITATMYVIVIRLSVLHISSIILRAQSSICHVPALPMLTAILRRRIRCHLHDPRLSIFPSNGYLNNLSTAVGTGFLILRDLRWTICRILRLPFDHHC